MDRITKEKKIYNKLAADYFAQKDWLGKRHITK